MTEYIIKVGKLYIGSAQTEGWPKDEAIGFKYKEALAVGRKFPGFKLEARETSYEVVWFCNFYEHMYWDKRGHWEYRYCELEVWRTKDYGAAVRKAKAVGTDARVVRWI